VVFGKEGFLYIGLGDGGGGDPMCNEQTINVLLGKMLRIDVGSPPAAGLNYAIPRDNPFAGQNGRDEIWLYGLAMWGRTSSKKWTDHRDIALRVIVSAGGSVGVRRTSAAGGRGR
jgi:hypothetical protein